MLYSDHKEPSSCISILSGHENVHGVGLMLFSHASYYALALLFAAVSAFGMMSQVTVTNTIIQTTVAPDMRGRVISIYVMAFFGLQPLGGLLVGFVSQHIGVQDTVLLEGCIAIVVGIFHFRFLRKHRLPDDKRPVAQPQVAEAALQT